MPATANTPTAEVTLTGTTVAFDIKGEKWVTRYSYIPEGTENLKGKFFSFRNGEMYRHGTGANNTFYGSADVSLVKVVSNFNPSSVKTYDSISLEGNDTWSASIETSDQNTSIATGDFSEKERGYYADIPRDNATAIASNTSNITVLGSDASASANVITFPNRVNRQPVPLGLSARVYKVDASGNVSDAAASAAYASSVTSTTLTLQDASGGAINASLAATDTIIIQTESKVDGDQMRDYYLVVELQNDNYSKDVELYAINLKYKPSKLNDSLGNQAEIQ